MKFNDFSTYCAHSPMCYENRQLSKIIQNSSVLDWPHCINLVTFDIHYWAVRVTLTLWLSF